MKITFVVFDWNFYGSLIFDSSQFYVINIHVHIINNDFTCSTELYNSYINSKRQIFRIHRSMNYQNSISWMMIVCDNAYTQTHTCNFPSHLFINKCIISNQFWFTLLIINSIKILAISVTNKCCYYFLPVYFTFLSPTKIFLSIFSVFTKPKEILFFFFFCLIEFL